MTRIKSLSEKHVSDAWGSAYGMTYGSAVLVHDVDVNGEWVKAQYNVAGNNDYSPEQSTPIRMYTLYSTAPDKETGESRYFFRIFGWRVYLDECMWRGGNIAETQRILVENGTLKAG